MTRRLISCHTSVPSARRPRRPVRSASETFWTNTSASDLNTQSLPRNPVSSVPNFPYAHRPLPYPIRKRVTLSTRLHPITRPGNPPPSLSRPAQPHSNHIASPYQSPSKDFTPSSTFEPTPNRPFGRSNGHKKHSGKKKHNPHTHQKGAPMPYHQGGKNPGVISRMKPKSQRD